MHDKITLRKSELVRSNNDRRKSNHTISRYEYIINLKFNLSGKIIKANAKVDTGSYYTVIGRDAVKHSDDIINKAILKEEPERTLITASGNIITAKPICVNNLKITEDIIFPKIKLYISEGLETKSVLGMDILTMFSFQYDKRDKTIWIMYEENFKDRLKKNMLNTEKDYIDPAYIALLDEL